MLNVSLTENICNTFLITSIDLEFLYATNTSITTEELKMQHHIRKLTKQPTRKSKILFQQLKKINALQDL